MRIVILQHVAFEGPGAIEPCLVAAGHRLQTVRLDRGEPLPAPDAFDGLVVMGGPMGVGDGDHFPWLAPELELLKAAIAAGKRLFGVCLGAQLLAAALGSTVTRNRFREIGWFPIAATGEAEAQFGDLWPERIEVFHWHGDTFALPSGAVRLASSAACSEQGFLYAGRVLGLQFHLEMTPDGVRELVAHGGAELDGSRHVQAAAALLADDPARYRRCHELLRRLLEQLFG